MHSIVVISRDYCIIETRNVRSLSDCYTKKVAISSREEDNFDRRDVLSPRLLNSRSVGDKITLTLRSFAANAIGDVQFLKTSRRRPTGLACSRAQLAQPTFTSLEKSDAYIKAIGFIDQSRERASLITRKKNEPILLIRPIEIVT